MCGSKTGHFFVRLDARDYWRCTTCVATFVDPAQLPDLDVERTHYALHHNDPNDPGYRGFLSRLATPLLERLATGQRGLDYGCGPGPALAAMLREAGHEVALYDPLFCADPTVLTGVYDFITCTEAAEHFHRPAQEFAQLDRLLAPGGWLGVMTSFTPNDSEFARWGYRRDPTHVVFYKAATFEALADCYGWRCEIPRDNVVLLQKPA